MARLAHYICRHTKQFTNTYNINNAIKKTYSDLLLILANTIDELSRVPTLMT